MAPVMEMNPASETSEKILHLEISRSGEDRLKISLSSRTSMFSETLRTYEETHLALEGITRRSRQLLQTLNQANRNGRLSPTLVQSLKETGQRLRDELLTAHIKERLNTSDADHMTIRIDEQLVHIPWELLHDGRQFLCQRFAVGRLVQTRRQFPKGPACRNTGPLQVLILSDLDGTLPASRKEGAEIRDFFESMNNGIRVMMRSANISAEFLRSKIRHYDWVHFAGHADADEDSERRKGWRLSDGWFTADDVVKMAGTGSMPSLVFANACQSARTDGWSMDPHRHQILFDLVNALLMAGTRHFVGTFWEIPDEPGRCFALAFYRFLMKGDSIGQAVSKARRHLMTSYGETQVIWASYVLYGDPTYRYPSKISLQTDSSVSLGRMPARQAGISAAAIRASGTKTPVTSAENPEKRLKKIPLIPLCGLGAAILTAAVMIPPSQLFRSPYAQLDQAKAAFHAGDYDKVLQLCPPVSTGSDTSVDCLLLRGNILFVRGNLDEAGAVFGFAKNSPMASPIETAEALIGLGRIASVRGHDQQAIAFYRQAAEAAPRRKEPFLALAFLHQRQGRDQEALTLVEAAEKWAHSKDPSIEALHRSLSAKAVLSREKEKRERIDRLIEELSEIAQHSPPRRSDDDDGIPAPKPVWIMEMASSGRTLQEGAAYLMTALIENHLQNHPSFRIVDRHLMETTLSELKVGSSALTDPRTRLQLGWLQAVRLMITGRIIFSDAGIQVSLRCIDTETSRVLAAAVSSFENRLPLPEIARQITDTLIQEIDQINS